MSMSRTDDDASGLGRDDFEAAAADVPGVQSWALGRMFNVWRGSIRLWF